MLGISPQPFPTPSRTSFVELQFRICTLQRFLQAAIIIIQHRSAALKDSD